MMSVLTPIAPSRRSSSRAVPTDWHGHAVPLAELTRGGANPRRPASERELHGLCSRAECVRSDAVRCPERLPQFAERPPGVERAREAERLPAPFRIPRAVRWSFCENAFYGGARMALGSSALRGLSLSNVQLGEQPPYVVRCRRSLEGQRQLSLRGRVNARYPRPFLGPRDKACCDGIRERVADAVKQGVVVKDDLCVVTVRPNRAPTIAYRIGGASDLREQELHRLGQIVLRSAHHEVQVVAHRHIGEKLESKSVPGLRQPVIDGRIHVGVGSEQVGFKEASGRHEVRHRGIETAKRPRHPRAGSKDRSGGSARKTARKMTASWRPARLLAAESLWHLHSKVSGTFTPPRHPRAGSKDRSGGSARKTARKMTASWRPARLLAAESLWHLHSFTHLTSTAPAPKPPSPTTTVPWPSSASWAAPSSSSRGVATRASPGSPPAVRP
jgi:hypothetical protein